VYNLVSLVLLKTFGHYRYLKLTGPFSRKPKITLKIEKNLIFVPWHMRMKRFNNFYFSNGNYPNDIIYFKCFARATRFVFA